MVLRRYVDTGEQPTQRLFSPKIWMSTDCGLLPRNKRHFIF